MIFVTVGSHPTFGFARLLQALEPMSSHEEIVVQHGPAPAPPGVARACPWLTFEEILDHMRAARVVVSHAGAGTLLCAHQLGHIPVVAPRLQRHGETVDDHQVDLARAFERTGQVLVAWEMEQLPELVKKAPARSERPALDNNGLTTEVRAALMGGPRRPQALA
jgi:UDP-N-acetylglucosamine transferase subunit ALG13